MARGKTVLISLLMLVMLSSTIFAAVPEGWGSGWSEVQVLGEASQYSGAPNVIKDSSGRIHVIWMKNVERNNQIVHLVLDKQGKVITEETQLTDAKEWKIRNYKVLLTPQQEILILLEIINNGTYQVQTYLVDPETATVIDKKQLLGFERPIQGLNGLFDKEGKLNLIWADLRASNYEIYFAQFTNQLDEVIAPTRLSYSPEVSVAANLAIDSKNQLHVIWNEYNGAIWDQKYRVFSNQGEPVSELISLGKTIEYTNQTMPQIAIDTTDRVHLVSIHSTKGGYGIVDYNVFYSLLDSKQNFIVRDLQVSDHADGYCTVSAAQLVLDAESKAHIVWADDMFGPLNNLYAVIQDGKIIEDQLRPAIIVENAWLPTLMLNGGEKHLLFMEFMQGGQYKLSYMNTLSEASTVYLNRVGIDISHPFSSLLYRFISLIFFSGLGVLMNFIPLSVAFLVIWLLDRWIKNIHWSIKFLLMVSIILLMIGSSYAPLPDSYSSFYELLAILLSLAIIFILTLIKKMYFDDGMTLILLEAFWLYAFLFLMQLPAGHLLMG